MRLRLALAVLLVALLSSSMVTSTDHASGASGMDQGQGSPTDTSDLIAIDQSEAQVNVQALYAVTDAKNRSVTISASDATLTAFTVLIRQRWLDSLAIVNPAFSEIVVPTTYADARWYGVQVTNPMDGFTLKIQQFTPEVGRPWYSLGSSSSILLQRPMFISLVETPHLELEKVTLSNSNGTWTEERPNSVDHLGISFDDEDTRGQTVVMNRSWLAGYSLGDVFFQYADGTSVANKSDPSFYYLSPTHFSILYAFTVGEGFMKESDQQYSDVHWDSTNRDIYILSDRRDPAGTNERMSSSALATYDRTTSFVVRGTWKTTQQGNWQSAIPLFFMAGSSSQIETANSIYVQYWSRDSNLGDLPLYYLRYRDSTGTLRINVNAQWLANVQAEFEFNYNGYTKTLWVYMYDPDGNSILSAWYSLGASETFTLNKVGAASCSCSSPHTSEPLTIGMTDGIFLEANQARNGNYEVDTNGDSVPDNWETWIWSDGSVFRSQDRAKFGSWSVKIPDSSSSLDYGLQTARTTVNPGQSFVGSVWTYSVSGSFWVCVELWNSASGGARIASNCKASTTTGTWEYLDAYLVGPSSTSYVDLLVYSSSSNVGTGFFDGAELRVRRAFWSVNVHDGEAGPGLAGWVAALGYLSDLGVSYARTDLRWSAFEPTSGGLDPTQVDYWRSVIRAAKARGIQLIGILNGPMPSWVPDASKYSEFSTFCYRIGQTFGADIYYYQLLNEMNHLAEVSGDAATFFGYCYAGLIAGESTTVVSHKSAFRTIVNAYADIPSEQLWPADMTVWLEGASNSIDIVAIDHYPMTYTAYPCNDWGALDSLTGIMSTWGKEGAVMETGFAASIWTSEQAAYAACALPVIHDKTQVNNQDHPTTPLVIASWYELVDEDSDDYFNPLKHFGLVFSPPDLGPKDAYGIVAALLPTFAF